MGENRGVQADPWVIIESSGQSMGDNRRKEAPDMVRQYVSRDLAFLARGCELRDLMYCLPRMHMEHALRYLKVSHWEPTSGRRRSLKTSWLVTRWCEVGKSVNCHLLQSRIQPMNVRGFQSELRGLSVNINGFLVDLRMFRQGFLAQIRRLDV